MCWIFLTLTWNKWTVKGPETDAVEAKLRSSSDDLGPAGVDKTYGYGFVNAQRAVLP